MGPRIFLVCLSVVLIAAFGAAGAGVSAPTKSGADEIVIGTAAANVEQSFTQVYIAAQRRYFASRGLNVVIRPFGAGLSAALASGQADLAFTSTGLAFALQHNGTPMRVLYNAIGGGISAATIASKPGITKISQCRSMVASAIGTTSYAWALVTRKLFHANFTIIPASSSSVITPAVVAGSVDCAIGAFSLVNPVVLSGRAHYVFNPLVKSQRPKGWPSGASETAMYATRNVIDKLGSATIVKILKALEQARKAMKNDSALNLAASVHAYPGSQPNDIPTIAAFIKILKPLAAPNKGYISRGTWDQIRRFFRAAGFGYMSTTDKNFFYKNIVDMSYYQKAIGKPPTK